MKKFDIDKNKIVGKMLQALPWIAGGTAIIGGGIILYNLGFKKGVGVGMNSGITLTIKEIADHLGESSKHFCIYNNSNNIPVVMTGIAAVSEEDVPKIVKMIESVEKFESEEATNNFSKNLVEVLFKGKALPK